MKNILLVICFAALALAQTAKKAAPAAAARKAAAPATAKAASAAPAKPQAPPPGPVTIPKDAVEVGPGLFQAKDAAGKTWHYTRTPFGVRRFEPENLRDTTAEEAARITVTGEVDGVVRFSRKTPFGTAGWSKQKDKLNPAEKMAVEHAASRPKDAGGSTSAAAKPSN